MSVMVFACALAPAAKGLQQTSPVEQNATAWKKLAPAEGGFMVLMPGTASEEKHSVETSVGKLENRIYSVETKQGVYMVMYADFPEVVSDADTIQRMLDNGRDKALANTKGKLTSEKNIKLDGYAGREWLVEIPGSNVIRARAFWVKRRLYQSLVIFPEGRNTPQETNRIRESATLKFLDSFALSDGTTAN
ncbi:MAG: hypothetical protein H0T60_05850 [Acidobacteria bacterium]|nr:hypothetical protein [Acidobacteriota bacterium]